MNKVTVRIFEKEYIISGDKTREQIIKIASHVDEKMKELSNIAPNMHDMSLAVLSAVTIAEEYYMKDEMLIRKIAEISKLKADSKQYEKLWEEAKQGFIQYKEEYAKIKEEYSKLKEEAVALKEKNDNLVQRVVAQEGDREQNASKVKQLEDKCAELESSFFEIQMENIQLKGEIDRYKKIVE